MKGGNSVFLNDDKAVVNITFPKVLMANSSTTSLQRLATIAYGATHSTSVNLFVYTVVVDKIVVGESENQ